MAEFFTKSSSQQKNWQGQLSPNILANAALVAFLLLSTIGLAPPAFNGGRLSDVSSMQSSAGDLPKQVLYFGLLIFSVSLRPPMSIKRVPVAIPFTMIAMVLWCWVSLTWSEVPETAVRRIILLTVGPIFIFSIVRFLGPVQALNLTVYTLSVILIADLVAVFILPGALQLPGVDFTSDTGGTWRGLHSDKNSAGAICALLSIISAYKVFSKGTKFDKRVLWTVVSFLAALFVYKSGSKTSLGLLPISAVLALLTLFLSKRALLLQLLVIALVGAIVILYLLSPRFFDLVSAHLDLFLRDPRSLTGRVQLWPILLNYSHDHPLLGSGYGSFWSVGDAGPMPRYASGWLLLINNAHNGYLDLLVQTGMIGLVLGVLAAIIKPFYNLLNYQNVPSDVRWLICAVLFFVAMHNFLEASLFDRDRPAWIVLILMLAVLSAYREPNRPKEWSGARSTPAKDIEPTRFKA